MAGSLSLDDQLLGEKTHYYCSSSEDEYNSCDEELDDVSAADRHTAAAHNDMNMTGPSSTTNSSNTGPKGVIADWRRFKQLESEKRAEQEKELVDLQKKLSITCRSHVGVQYKELQRLDDEKANDEDAELMRELEDMDDEFMKEYRNKRMEEMLKMFRDIPRFGSVIELKTAEEFLEATDNTHPSTTVIVHLYENNDDACSTMNHCLAILCKEYSTVKFCKILAHKAKLSSKFSEEGIPALLVYRKGELVGNLVALRDQLGVDFFSEDVEALLTTLSLLPSRM